MIHSYTSQNSLKSPLGSLECWKPYIFQILEHFLDRDDDLKVPSTSHKSRAQGTDDEQGQKLHDYISEQWSAISNRLFHIGIDYGIKSKTIQNALILTRTTLHKLTQLIPVTQVDFGLLAFSALRIAFKNQSNHCLLNRFDKISQYDPNELTQAEIFISNTLDWKLHIPTPYEFIECLLYAINPDVQWLHFIGLCEKVVKFCLTHFHLSTNSSAALAIASILIVSENYNFDSLDLETSGVEFQFAFLQHIHSSSLPIKIISSLDLKRQILLNLYDGSQMSMKQAVRNHNELVEDLIDQEIVQAEEGGSLFITPDLLSLQINDSPYNLLAEENSLTFTICNDLDDIKLSDPRDEKNSLHKEQWQISYISSLGPQSQEKQTEDQEENSELIRTSPESKLSAKLNQMNNLKVQPAPVGRKRSFNLVKRIQQTMSYLHSSKESSMPSSVDQLAQQASHHPPIEL